MRANHIRSTHQSSNLGARLTHRLTAHLDQSSAGNAESICVNGDLQVGADLIAGIYTPPPVDDHVDDLTREGEQSPEKTHTV